MLSAVTKELKESKQTVESARKRPFSPKMREEITVPAKVKKHTKYKLWSQKRAELLDSSTRTGDASETVLAQSLPENPLRKTTEKISGPGWLTKDPNERGNSPEVAEEMAEESADVPKFDAEMISSRTRSKAMEAKTVQAEPVTTSAGISTFSSVPKIK